MVPLSDISNSVKLSSGPKLEYEAHSPPKTIGSPARLGGSPTRLGRSPSRVSPFKGPRATMTDQEIFATTPRRLAYYKSSSKAQSADRAASAVKKEINFNEMKNTMAPSTQLKSQHTPSRMIQGRKSTHISGSEQPISRASRPLAAMAPILKRKLSPPEEQDDEGNDTDMRTAINTKRNSASARSVLNYLTDSSATTVLNQAKNPSPIKKKRLVNFEKPVDVEPNIKSTVQQDITIELLQQILENQRLILQRLASLEDK